MKALGLAFWFLLAGSARAELGPGVKAEAKLEEKVAAVRAVPSDMGPFPKKEPTVEWCDGGGTVKRIDPGFMTERLYEAEVCGLSDGSLIWRKKK